MPFTPEFIDLIAIMGFIGLMGGISVALCSKRNKKVMSASFSALTIFFKAMLKTILGFLTIDHVMAFARN
ncbi:MAG: hypothetical protein AABY34_05575 [Pseudomonadota bacterium]